jgi:hypothetical protein
MFKPLFRLSLILGIILITSACTPTIHVYLHSSESMNASPIQTDQETPSQSNRDIKRPEFTLWLDRSYTVYRNGIDGESNWKPVWVVLYNGEVVLRRNAVGETSYKYFRSLPGTYSVYVEVWVEDHYQVGSNIVSYYLSE